MAQLNLGIKYDTHRHTRSQSNRSYYRDDTMPQNEECVSADGLDAKCEEGTFLESLDVYKGYYRFRSDSKNIIKCPVPAACGGGTGVADASCKQGYYGALCSACQVKITS